MTEHPTYYILNGTEDGLAVHAYTELRMRELLTWNKDEGCLEMKIENGCDRFLNFDEIDFNNCNFEDACVIIKGEVIIPQPKKVVTEFYIS